MRFADAETGPEVEEHTGRQALGEYIGELRARGHVKDADFTKGDALPDEVQIDLDMFSVLMLHRVDQHVHGADVVAVDHHGARRRVVELTEELSEPYGLCDGIGYRPVFCLDA